MTRSDDGRRFIEAAEALIAQLETSRKTQQPYGPIDGPKGTLLLLGPRIGVAVDAGKLPGLPARHVYWLSDLRPQAEYLLTLRAAALAAEEADRPQRRRVPVRRNAARDKW